MGQNYTRDDLDRINVFARRRAAELKETRPKAKGISIDAPNTRIIDDGIFIQKTANQGWVVEVSIADLPALLPPGDPVEANARQCQDERKSADGHVERIFPHAFLLNHVSLQQDILRPAITFCIELDHDLNITKTSIFKSMFKNCQQFSMDEVHGEIKRGDKTLGQWAALAQRLHEKQRLSLVQTGDAIVSGNPESLPGPVADRVHNKMNMGDMIVHETMRLANRAASDYLTNNHLTAPFRVHHKTRIHSMRVSPSLKFDQACNRWAHNLAIEMSKKTPAYARVSSPMRHYSDYLTLKIIGRHLDGQASDPALCSESNTIKAVFNQQVVHTDDPKAYVPIWESMVGRPGLHGADRNPQSMILTLQRVCAENHWKPPLVAERTLEVDGRTLHYAAIGFSPPRGSYENTQAVSHNAESALEMAAFRMTHLLNEIYPGQLRKAPQLKFSQG